MSDTLERRKQQCIKEMEISQEAKAVLESPLVKAFFDQAKAAAMSRWAESPDDATEARERLFFFTKMLAGFENHFKGAIINGEFAEKQLDQIIAMEPEKKH